MIILVFALLVMGLLALLGRLYRRRWDSGLSVALAFSSPEAVEGAQLVLREEITNGKMLPLPMLTVKLQLSRNLLFETEQEAAQSDNYYRRDVFALSVYQRVVRKHPFVCGKRGYYPVENLSLVCGGLFHREVLEKRLNAGTALTVFPKPVPFDQVDILYRQVVGDIEVRRFTSPDPFAFRGIREYEPGDDLKHVNFKASAKTGNMMVNLYSPTASRQVVILLNVEPHTRAGGEQVQEGAIRLATSAAACFIDMGFTVGLVTNGQDVQTGREIGILPGGGQNHLHTLLVGLARIKLPAGAAPFAHMMPRPDKGAAQPYYLLISAGDSAEVAGAYADLRQNGEGARWYMPVHPSNPKTESPAQRQAGITCWEVPL